MAGKGPGDELVRLTSRLGEGSFAPFGPLLRDSLRVLELDDEEAAGLFHVRLVDLVRWKKTGSQPSDRRVRDRIIHKLWKLAEYRLGRARPTGTLPRLRLALQDMRHHYHCGLGGGDCDGDYDFGYESGLDSACKAIVEDLDRLIAEFFPKARK